MCTCACVFMHVYVCAYMCMCDTVSMYSKIRLRQQAVAELSLVDSPSLVLLKATFHKLPDLEQKLCSAYHKKVC